MLAGDADGGRRGWAPASGVRLLPAFDQYVVAATLQAGHFLAGDFRDRIYRPQGWLSPVLLVDGVMAGVWRHERKGRRLVVEVEPFGKVSRAAAAPRRRRRRPARRLPRGGARARLQPVANVTVTCTAWSCGGKQRWRATRVPSLRRRPRRPHQSPGPKRPASES